MLILLHVIIALGSVVYTSYLFFSPTKNHIRISYTLVGATLASGTYLVISTHSPLLASCATGLIYIAIVLTGIVAARRRLIHVKAKNKDI